MKNAKGLIVLLSPDRAGQRGFLPGFWPDFWKIGEGRILSRSRTAPLESVEEKGPVMLVLPPGPATLRRVELDPALPPAQARAVAVRKALEAGIADPAEMHGVALEAPETGEGTGVHHVATIARSDLAHILDWAQGQGLDPDIILPAGALLPVPDQGFVRADLADMALVRGQAGVACAHTPWMQPFYEAGPVEAWPAGRIEAALIAALERPPVNLRTGAFARRRRGEVDARWLRHMGMLAGVILLLSVSISLALIARYYWSASRLDARTVEMARAYAPNARDAVDAAAQIDQQVAGKGGAFAFSGPLAGLMQAMRPVPGVSLTQLSLGEDGLLHATLAAARAEDINAALLSVQGAGFKITASSSTDPGGRVLAEITVRP